MPETKAAAECCEECGQASGWNEVELPGLLARVVVERCDACEQFVDDVTARSYLLRMLKAAPDLLAALKAMLPLVQSDRRNVIECHSVFEDRDGKVRPVPGTLDPEAAIWVAQYDHAISLASHAIAKAEGGIQ